MTNRNNISVLKKEIEAIKSTLTNMGTVEDQAFIERYNKMTHEERQRRIMELSFKVFDMPVDISNSMTEAEKEQFLSDIVFLYTSKKKGKSIIEALEALKEKNPNYRKELELYDSTGL